MGVRQVAWKVVSAKNLSELIYPYYNLDTELEKIREKDTHVSL